MIISDKHQFIFVHIPKSGGTSCRTALSQILAQKEKTHWAASKTTKHETLKQVKDRFEQTKKGWWLFRQKFDNYFKFGFVRNPWCRMVSFYHYLKKTEIKPEIKQINSFEHFITEMGQQKEWIIKLYSMQPQYHFLIDHDGKMIADFVGRYERLEEDFNQVCVRLKLKLNLPHLNTSSHRPYQAYYNEKSKELVRQRFFKDIEYFDYTF